MKSDIFPQFVPVSKKIIKSFIQLYFFTLCHVQVLALIFILYIVYIFCI